MKSGTRSMSMGGSCPCGGMCSRCKGWVRFLAGLVLVANGYWNFADWWMLVGILVALGGLMRILMPHCPHCK